MGIKSEQTVKVSVLQTLPCRLPTTVFDGEIDVERIAKPFVDSLNQLSSNVLAAESVWRDVFALTGTLRTIYSSQSIAAAWSETRSARYAQGFELIPGSGKVIRPDNTTGWLQAGFTFTTAAAPAALCHGFLTLMLTEDRQWTIWTIRTILEQLVGCGNVDVLPVVAEHTDRISTGIRDANFNGVNGTHKSSTALNGSDAKDLTLDYDVIIAGGGQAGLSTAGRLQALGVKYVVLETHKGVGENWAVRYNSAKLHTPRNYSQMPFGRVFDSSYQEYLDKHDLAKGYQEFIRRFDIEKNIQFNSTLEGGSWEADNKIWTLRVRRSGEQQKLTCRHVVIAVGSGGQIPLMPSFPGHDLYQGEVLHSVDYRSADKWKGKSAIVVGTANTAHDVASDMVDAGLKTITMIQRNRTYVLPAEYFKSIADRSYNERAQIDDVDREQYSQAVGISRLLSLKALHAMARKEPERFDALEKAGFKVERYGDIIYQINEKRGGHYIDVGCSAKIARGQIHVKSDALVTRFTQSGLAFDDGSEVSADVIVFCTGFRGNMRLNVEELFGSKIAAQVDDFYTLDAEGELKGAFKPTGHPGLWYIGGTIGYCRYFSRHIALQIKADLEGAPLPVYGGYRRM